MKWKYTNKQLLYSHFSDPCVCHHRHKDLMILRCKCLM
ncbi:hypothetical protein EVA_18183 [gut metagenome]|uniref:Uncharacterized protein n=1 Tax=gut metagenome TaxID=749906 RepID=J9FFM3_9ZZZZ